MESAAGGHNASVEGISPGQIIDGRYQIVDELGQGGMGVVLRARHTEMDRTVAIKLLKPALLPDRDKIDRFMREARTVSKLKHENIVNVYSVGLTEDGQPYIAMEYLEGKRLSDLIETQGFLPAADALPIFIQVCDALSHAHQKKIVHRDIKPTNIMIVEEQGKQTVKVVDFGIAKSVAENVPSVTQTGLLMGSAFYMSPGQCAGRVSDLRSDVYSLGCTLFEALTGKPPFRGDTFFETLDKQLSETPLPVNEANPQAKVSSELQSVIDCMLQKDPVNRYQSMDQLKSDFQRVLTGQSAVSIPAVQKSDAAYLKGLPASRLPKAAPVAVVFVVALCAMIFSLPRLGSVLKLDQPGKLLDEQFYSTKAVSAEQNGSWDESAKYYLLAADAARQNANVRLQASALHRAGRVLAKKGDSLRTRQGYMSIFTEAQRHIDRATDILENFTKKASNKKTAEFQRSMALLSVCYFDGFVTSVNRSDEQHAMLNARKYVNAFIGENVRLGDKTRPLVFCTKCLDYLIRHDAEIDAQQVEQDIRTYQKVAKEGGIDPVIIAAKMAEYKALLKEAH